VARSYHQTLEYLYAQLPVYHHIGSAAYKKDLTNTIALCQSLGNPHKKFKSIHVAGTNGKGSSSHMLAAILQTAGYTTGLYTSPHLKDFGERIKVNGKEVRKDFVVEFVDSMQPQIEKIQPSFFELTVAMAFEYFAVEQVDIAVIEVGLGGRLDSTNIIDPEISLITNIGFDHMDILGDTLSAIAKEKAGIIKPGRPVVISERQPEIENIFIEKAREYQSPIYFAQDCINTGKLESNDFLVAPMEFPSFEISPDLKGQYQEKNIKGVIQTALLLNKFGYTVSPSSIINGVNNTVKLTGLKGRWQTIHNHPPVICDTAHNVEGLREIINQIANTPHKNLRWVFGMVKDKSPDKVLAILPTDAQYYFCQAKIPRAMNARDLFDKALENGLKGKVVPDVNEALRSAMADSGPEDLILVGGSTFVVGEVDGL
jgi:dihydrofolate synthase/folylpolyglutamate synthase